MQILNIESKNVKKIQHLDFINSISDINFFDDELFAIGSTINGDGILNFTLYNGEYRYSNFYRSFPSTISKINDLVIVEDEVIFSHSDGIYKSNINGELYSGSSWESVPFFDNKMILSMTSNYIITNDGMYLVDGEQKLSLELDSILVSIEDTTSNTFNWLTQNTFYEWSESGLWTFDNPFNEGANSIYVSYNSMDRWGSLIVLSATNHGLTIINRENNSVKLYIPNSIITNEISALHLDDNGNLYGVGREGGFVKKGTRITNFYTFSKGYSYPNKGDGYNAVKLNYHTGDFFPTAITTISSGNFIFNIYGRRLDVENNSGAVLEVNSNNWNYTLYGDENNIFDGTNGIVDNNSGGLYAQVPQIKKDNNGNIWCLNSFSENYNQPFAIMDNTGEWHHIIAPDNYSYIPLDFDFSKNGNHPCQGWFAWK